MKNGKQPWMLLTNLLVISNLFILCGNINGQQKGTFTDSRDKTTYSWMQIGKQAWMTGILKYKTTEGSWAYNNDTANVINYGRLYDWNTASKSCPKGWHLPTDAEWGKLIATLGGEDLTGIKLQELDSIHGNFPSTGSGNTKTFSGLLGGIRHSDGSFAGLGLWGGCWSATLNNTDATNYLFAQGSKSISKSTNDKASAFSVKCVRNK